MLEITAPKGTKGAWLGDKDRSSHPGEAEFLVPRNATYTVTGMSKKEGKVHLHVTVHHHSESK